jgi:hypothetical protein
MAILFAGYGQADKLSGSRLGRAITPTVHGHVAAPKRRPGLDNWQGERRCMTLAVDTGAAIATVDGVLVEGSAMLSVVRIVEATRGWYEGRPIAAS